METDEVKRRTPRKNPRPMKQIRRDELLPLYEQGLIELHDDQSDGSDELKSANQTQSAVKVTNKEDGDDQVGSSKRRKIGGKKEKRAKSDNTKRLRKTLEKKGSAIVKKCTKIRDKLLRSTALPGQENKTQNVTEEQEKNTVDRKRSKRNKKSSNSNNKKATSNTKVKTPPKKNGSVKKPITVTDAEMSGGDAGDDEVLVPASSPERCSGPVSCMYQYTLVITY